MIELQPPVPRNDSLKVQFAHQCWAQGLTPFFIDKVPFSSGSSKLLAKIMGDIIREVSSKEGPIIWAEVGAGLGFFGRKLLDGLAETHPEFYKRFTFISTNFEKNLVNHTASSTLFCNHRHHSQFQQLDVFNAQFKTPPQGLFFSYLFDDLPTAHIHVKAGVPWVIWIRSMLKPNTVITRTDIFPPLTLVDQEIADLIEKKEPIPAPLARRILPFLVEESLEVPLDESELSSQDREDVLAFIQDQTIQDGYFNITLNSRTLFTSLYEALSPEGMLFIRDFGHQRFTMCQDPALMKATYGGTIFFPIYSPFIQFMCRQVGFASSMVSDLPDETYQQFIAISKKADLSVITPHFQEIVKVDNLIDAVEDVRQSIVDKKEVHWDNLPEDIRDEYTLLDVFVASLVDHSRYQEAIDHGLNMADAYRSSGLTIFLNVGRAYQHMGDSKRAELYFKEALHISPDYAPAHLELGLLYTLQNRLPEAFTTFISYLKTASKVSWSTYITLSLISIQLGKSAYATAMIEWLISTADQHANLVPQSIADQARMIHVQFLSTEPTL